MPEKQETHRNTRESSADCMIGVVGFGLIGASIVALAIEELKGVTIKCYEANDNHIELLEESYENVVFVESVHELTDCNYIFIATPPDSVCGIACDLLSDKKCNSIVVDVASTKKGIDDCIRSNAVRYQKYLGGHPLAGGNTEGPEFSSADVLRNATFIITPHESFCAEDLQAVRKLLSDMSFDVICMSTSEHDEILALTSHLPHLISYAYSNVLISASRNKDIASVASKSTRGISYFASSNVEMWVDIFSKNDFLYKWLDELIVQLIRIRRDSRTGDLSDLAESLTTASELQRTVLKSNDKS